MTTLIFSNADYYKNEEFQKLMRKWNGLNDYKDCNPEVYEEIVENLKNEFYRISNEWLFSLDGTNIDNYSSLSWKVGLE
jgi:hypothetical protein